MDLVSTLRKKIDLLGDGEFVPGLMAVLLHVETAFRHLSRGQETGDETAFTDSIYRCNQAFEGSLKEAYRVFTEQDPSKEKPYVIESYLVENEVFSQRVMALLRNYRTEWRNPSAHDYKLYFDEGEAFLAIISVTAFACLLIDQISGRLSYDSSQAEALASNQKKATPSVKLSDSSYSEKVGSMIAEFCEKHLPAQISNETQLIGALHGFIGSTASDFDIGTEVTLDPQQRYRADMIVTWKKKRLLIEVKRAFSSKTFLNALSQLEVYLINSRIKEGVLLFAPQAQSKMNQIVVKFHTTKANVRIIYPATEKLPSIIKTFEKP